MISTLFEMIDTARDTGYSPAMTLKEIYVTSCISVKTDDHWEKTDFDTQ